MADETILKIEEIDLWENNIFLLNTLKKVRAYYFEEEYKIKSSEDFIEWTELTITINDNKIQSLTKLKKPYLEIVKPELIKYWFVEENKTRLVINLEKIQEYFEKVDIKKIEEEYLQQSFEIQKSEEIVKLENLTFNDKVQKIYSTIEKITDQKSTLNQLIEETLESDEAYVELQNEKKQILEQIKNRKEELLSGTTLEEKSKEITNELKEEKWILNEFLEFSIEKWDYKEVEVLNKEWKKMKPVISISLKQIKE